MAGPAEAAAAKQPSPGSVAGKPTTERKRIPMSAPVRKLEVPEGTCPGYHLYWFLGRNVARAQQGGYEFVNADEVSINQRGVATDSMISGNADMGTRVCVVAGEGEKETEYLYLMKIKSEWWQEDQKVIEQRNQRVIDAIFKSGEQGIAGSEAVPAADRTKRYVKTSLFERSK